MISKTNKIFYAILLCFLAAQVRTLRLHGMQEFNCEELKPDEKDVDVSLLGKFKVSLCRSSDLHGYFRIEKLTGCDSTDSKLSLDEETDLEAHLLGQDEFLLELEGLEVRALEHDSSLEMLRKCVYNLRFQLTVPGTFHVNLGWFRENFASVKEIEGLSWPENYMYKPLGNNMYVEIGSQSLQADALSRALNPKDLPQCNLHNQNEGRWVFTGKPSDVFENPPTGRCFNTDGSKACAKNVRLQPAVDYKQFTWRHDKCQQKVFTRRDAATCMKDKSLELQGDSNMRKVFEDVVKFACGAVLNETADHQLSFEREYSEKTLCKSYPGCKEVCLNTDMMGDVPPRLDKDLTVSNFGQHPADGQHRFTLQAYKSEVDKFVSSIEANPEKKNFAWMETPLVPFRNDAWVHKKADTRTGHRLKLFNKYANEKFTSIGVPIVASYERVRAFSQHTPDDAHYPPEVLQPIVNDILNLLCTN